MKRKNKKILFLVSEAVLAGTSVFGMMVVLFDLMPDFPRYVIIICALLVALSKTITYFKVQKKFGADTRVDLQHFDNAAMNWAFMCLYWLFLEIQDVFWAGVLCLCALVGCLVSFFGEFRHYKPCSVKFADKPSKK